MAAKSVARKDPDISPVRQALTRVAQNFQVSLAPFPEEAAALAFKEDATTFLVKGITSAERHQTALQLLRDGKRLRRSIDEHWMKVKRWLEDRKKDIGTIAAMDLQVVEPGLNRLNVVILAYEEAEKARVALAQAIERQRQEEEAQRKRAAELAQMEKDALAAEQQSEQLSDRERAFAQAVYQGISPEMAAKRAGYKDPQAHAARLLNTPKIAATIEGMQQAKALRDQAAAVKEKPIEIREPEVQANLGKVAWVRTQTSWTAECFDFDLFIDKFVAGEVDRQTFRTLVMPNAVAGNEMARALHENLDRIPGWRHVKKVTKAG